MHMLFVFDNQDRCDRNNTERGQDKRALIEEYAKSKKGAKEEEKNRVENRREKHFKETARIPQTSIVSREWHRHL